MKKTVFFVTRSALVAAVYFALATALQPVSFGPVQFRLSEALVLLPVFMPESIIGVTLGCFLSNFFYSTMYDVIFGTVATGVAAVLTFLLRRTKFLYVLPSSSTRCSSPSSGWRTARTRHICSISG